MEQNESRELKQGFADAFAAAFEMVVTPVIFGFLGWLLDGQIGTSPLFTVAFVLLTVAYASWKTFHNYTNNLEHQVAERRKAWRANGPLV
ncbi:MAG TPA: AtpZ/AtpI family protein [Acidimicrobiia bacterium]|jgi:F0F1-type ATP synthase assembly protein I|nr:AtpZ/AtpI family protein [Actinomycetota bacterium]HIL46483.1 AtpZ/AtpI family protein [Acidimicrobiia bacterium]MBT3746457.1 AtpZ/AtpI family protein [Actinomycetota bacterium]MBT3970578.1 AtpZ/AtpI family protein [Actinomycetota bacterium]MBT4009323.1 AtpZ/AtpI family protein [Actinomycetota bacterium]